MSKISIVMQHSPHYNAVYGIMRTHERPRVAVNNRGHEQPVSEVTMPIVTHRHCPRCDTTKPLSDFHKGRNAGGAQSYCKTCKSAISYYRPGTGVREDLTGQRKNTWTVVRWAARGKWLVRCDCGQEKVIFASNWRSGNGVRTCSCIVRPPNYNQLAPGDAACNELRTAYRRRAEQRGHTFELTPFQFRLLTSMDCAYCGAIPSQKNYTGAHKKGDVYTYNGVDRVDSALGYTWDNCKPCCRWCNIAKSNLPLDAWLAHIRQIYNYMHLGET